VATGPISVNLLASTAYNIAVGGTVLNENGRPTVYWSTTNTGQESALSYIPEDVWNDSCLAATCGSDANIAAGSGGASIFVSKPVWQQQTAITGYVNDGFRDLPDVSLTAALHDGYVLCLEASCVPNAQNEFYLALVGGTSASTPSFAGIMAMVVQQMASTNPGQSPRQGVANYVLYGLAAQQNANLATCNGSNTATLPASTCIFNDVTTGNNAVPGELNYGFATADYQAGVGYDMATGLGSVNIANLVSAWNSITFTPTTTTLNLAYSTITHGSSVNFSVTVAPSSGSGVPTGDVSLLTAQQGGQLIFTGGLGMFSLGSGGTVASSTNDLPGGPYFVEAHYAGDGNYAPSDSTMVPMEITPESSRTILSVLTFDAQGNQLVFTNGAFGSFVYLRADVAGLSGYGTPTGTVNFTDTFGTVPGGTSTGLSLSLNSGDAFQSGANTATPNGILNFDTGTHTISASYSGDFSFNASSTTQSLSFTITPGFFVAPSSNQAYVNVTAPGSAGTTSLAIANSTGFSGTITLSCSGLPVGAACAFSPSTVTAAGTPATTNSTMTVTTTAATAALRLPTHAPLSRWLAVGIFACFSVVMVGAPARRRSAGLLLLLAVIAFVPACGGGGSSTPAPQPTTPTPAGTYNLVVNATSGSTSSTTSITLYVQ
jgi:hypothetical protein